jgi:hypothetical protein
LADVGITVMNYFEKFKMSTQWQRMNYRLHQYWYVSGLMKSSGSARQLRRLINNHRTNINNNEKLTIDLQQGLKKAEAQIDQLKPLEIDIYYGTKFIGTINNDAGSEQIKGYHLRKLLKEKFSEQLAEVLFPHAIFKKSN